MPGGAMQPEFVEKEAFHVMGLQSSAPFENDDFETVWTDCLACHEAVRAYSADGVRFGRSPGHGEQGLTIHRQGYRL